MSLAGRLYDQRQLRGVFRKAHQFIDSPNLTMSHYMRQSGEDMNQSAKLATILREPAKHADRSLIAPNRPVNGPFLTGLTHIAPLADYEH